MIRNISHLRNISNSMSATLADVPPIFQMVNNFFSVVNTSIARIRDRFDERDISITINEVIEGNISWNVRMQWGDVQGRQHEKIMNGLFEIPATTETRLMMEMQYRHYITPVSGTGNNRELVEFDEMWYNGITYVRMLEFIRALEGWMMSVELDRS